MTTKLVLEEYFYDHSINSLHPLHSTTKSIFSLLIGIAIEQNKFLDLSKDVFDFFPEYKINLSEKSSRLKLEHLITLTAGFDEEYDAGDECEWIECSLKKPVIFEPGHKFQYDSECPAILGEIFKRTTGMHVDEFAESSLFRDIGIKKYHWVKEENGYPITSGDQGSIFLRSRDLLKIGLLMNNRGKWKNKQIITEDWINKSTQSHVDKTHLQTEGYGYYWWIQRGGIYNHEKPMVFAQGSGFQVLMLIPEKNMVIVVTAGNHFDMSKNHELWKSVLEMTK